MRHFNFELFGKKFSQPFAGRLQHLRIEQRLYIIMDSQRNHVTFSGTVAGAEKATMQ